MSYLRKHVFFCESVLVNLFTDEIFFIIKRKNVNSFLKIWWLKWQSDIRNSKKLKLL